MVISYVKMVQSGEGESGQSRRPSFAFNDNGVRAALFALLI